MKKVFSFLFKLLGILVLAVAVLLGWLTVTEFNPAPVEAVEVTRAGDADTLKGGDTLTVLSWNVGYGGLGKDSDFFMDGGKDARSADEATVKAYLGGISATIAESQADLVLLQEVDTNSSRTYGIDERNFLSNGMSCEAYAMNYSCPFVPVPMPPIGKETSTWRPMTTVRARSPRPTSCASSSPGNTKRATTSSPAATSTRSSPARWRSTPTPTLKTGSRACWMKTSFPRAGPWPMISRPRPAVF